ncbi:MAG: IPExxxVDY family protein [Bacteroidales bacterium]
MVKKKGTLSGNYANEFTIIGIACHIPEYRVVHFLNKISNFSFIRYNDLMVYKKNNEDPQGFAFYYFDDIENCATYHLISNRGSDGIMINEWKQIDFLLIASISNQNIKFKSIVTEIKKVPNVLAVSQMLPTKKIEIDNLLTDLELHINEIRKKEKEKDKEIANKLKTNRLSLISKI